MPIGFGSSNLAGAAGNVVKNFGNKLKSDRGEGKIDSLPEDLNKFGRSDSFDQTVLRYPIDLGNTYSKYAIKFDIFLQTDAKIVVPDSDSNAKKEADKEAGAKEQSEDTKLQKIEGKKTTKEDLSKELRNIELKYLKIKDYNTKDPKEGFWANGYKVGKPTNPAAWKEFEKGGGTKKFRGVGLTPAEKEDVQRIRAEYFGVAEKWDNANSEQKTLASEKNETKKREKDRDFDTNAMTLRRDSVFKHESSIALYFPAKVTNNTTATYQDVDVSNYTTAAASSVMGNISTLFGGGKVDLSSLKSMIGNFEALIQDQIEQALPGLRESGEIMSGRNIRSDRMEVAFKGVARRSFSFDFKFMPKSEKEAIEVKKIIKRFRTYQMPNLSTSRMAISPKDGERAERKQENIDRNEQLRGGGKPKTDGKIYYDSPGFFDISFMIKANENNYPIKMGRSVLESVNVTYGGARTSFFKSKGGEFKEADGAPTEITMSLSFKEVETLYRDRVAKDGY